LVSQFDSIDVASDHDGPCRRSETITQIQLV